MVSGRKVFVEAIHNDNPTMIESAYSYYRDFGENDRFGGVNQLEYALINDAEACAFYLLRYCHFQTTKKCIKVAFLKQYQVKLICGLIWNADDRDELLELAIIECYKRDNYKLLLKITKDFDLSYNSYQLKVLGFPNNMPTLIENGAVYDVYDYLHVLLKSALNHEAEAVKYLSDCWNFTNEKGNIIHNQVYLYNENKGIYYYDEFTDSVMVLFNNFEIDPLYIGADGNIAAHYLCPDKTENSFSLYKKWIEKYGATQLLEPFIFHNCLLDPLIENGLPKNFKINGKSIFDYTLDKNKFHSLASLYGFAPDFKTFIKGRHIILIAFDSIDKKSVDYYTNEYAVQELFKRGLGYNTKEFMKIGKGLLAPFEYAYGIPAVHDKQSNELIIYDIIVHYSEKLEYIPDLFDFISHDKRIDLKKYDPQLKYLHNYFQHPNSHKIVPLQFLINKGASVIYGSPIRILCSNGSLSYRNFNALVEQAFMYEKFEDIKDFVGDIRDQILNRSISVSYLFEAIKEGSMSSSDLVKTIKQNYVSRSNLISFIMERIIHIDDLNEAVKLELITPSDLKRAIYNEYIPRSDLVLTIQGGIISLDDLLKAIRYGLITNSGLIEMINKGFMPPSALMEAINRKVISPTDLISFLTAVDPKGNNIKLEIYDETVQFMNIWNNSLEIKTIENYKFLRSLGASSHYMQNIKFVFDIGVPFDDIYDSFNSLFGKIGDPKPYYCSIFEDILDSYIKHKMKLPPLENDENYILLAISSKSMHCKAPSVLHKLIELGIDPKPIEDRLWFQLIDDFILSTDIYQALIEDGVNINVINQNGETPLIYLLKNVGICENRYKVAKLFAKNGININAKDNKGYTALSVAKLEKDKKMIKILK